MDKKKLAAAISAVHSYIKTSEEAAAFHAGAFEPVGEVVNQQVHMMMQPANIWGLAGRHAHMQTNALLQMKMTR